MLVLKPRPLIAALLLAMACGCASSPGRAPSSQAAASSQPQDTARLRAEQEQILWQRYHGTDTARSLRAMLDSQTITVDSDSMPFTAELIWDDGVPMPEAGYPVFISLHGGGAFTEQENHDEWVKQQTRYPGVRGLYVCPHSPMDTWDQWHNQRVFALIDALVRALLLRDDIDPNRVYLNGYCSGGNGVYQLAPHLADRFAACSATKAIREGAPLKNLRNLPIDLQWGEHDHEPLDRPGRNRADVEELLAMHRADPTGYAFRDIEHWRQGRVVNDKSTVRWMSRYTRDPYPTRVVWHQDASGQPTSNPPQRRLYWLGVDEHYKHDGTLDRVDAQLDRATNTIQVNAGGYNHLQIYLNDAMLDLDRPVRLIVNGELRHNALVPRSDAVLWQSLLERGDPTTQFHAMITLDLPG